MAAITNQIAKSASKDGLTLRRLARYSERKTPSNTAQAINKPYQRIDIGPISNKIGPGD